LKILLDTHVFLWAITGDPRLSAMQRSVYTDEANDLYLSVASVWEILIKSGLGKLPLPTPSAAWLVREMEDNRIASLSIRISHLTELERLPSLHRDPFDRMLIAQARAEKIPILSADPEIRRYDVALI
jgi:PIN domain nuclease of toxin-antitoxin system